MKRCSNYLEIGGKRAPEVALGSNALKKARTPGFFDRHLTNAAEMRAQEEYSFSSRGDQGERPRRAITIANGVKYGLSSSKYCRTSTARP
jgi:hypothetical protein